MIQSGAKERTPMNSRANWIFGILGAVVLIGVGILYGLGRKHVDESEPPQLTVGGAAVGEPVERLLLYFGNPEHVGLVREPRVIASGLTLEERIANCVRELATGSLRENLPVVPPETRLRRAHLVEEPRELELEEEPPELVDVRPAVAKALLLPVHVDVPLERDEHLGGRHCK